MSFSSHYSGSFPAPPNAFGLFATAQDPRAQHDMYAEFGSVLRPSNRQAQQPPANPNHPYGQIQKRTRKRFSGGSMRGIKKFFAGL